ncbi:MAG: RDD family protein [Thaumarchaeota archaeon]|nr:RDD family protein [Nitrososphaerota archaeon]
MGAEKELVIAKWSDRFIAWLIDFIVVGAIAEAVFTVFALPFAFRFPNLDFNDVMNTAFGSVLQVRSLVFLAYWTYFESTSGQSLGKKVMNLKVVDMNGNVPTLAKAFLQALGKAFILVLDVIVGWIFLSENRQRLLNKLTDTLVIKVKPLPPSGVKLVKEQE